MKRTLLLALILALFFISSSGQEIKASSQSNSIPLNSIAQDEKQLEELKQRFSVKYAAILSSSVWALTHDYKSKTEVDNVLNFLKAFFTALQANDKAKLQEIGGAKGFKDKFLEFLKSEDGTVKGFAAIVLGIAGDASYAPQIAALLDERDKSFTDRSTYPPVTYRGRAATALGVMGAREYAPKIALLLKSQNDYDRAGAVSALGFLGAKEYAREIVALLADKDFQHIGDVSPIYFLIETGTAKDYKKELVDVMLGELGSEAAEAAIYALVHLGSKENAKHIVKLLRNKFRNRHAAMALALLDAKEYADEIASMLGDESGLVRNDAALALGIMKAGKHSNKVAELLKDKEGYVRYYAAVSLILMEAKEYYKEAVSIIEETHKSGAYLSEASFHPLMSERSRQINANFKQLLEQAKSLN